MILQFITYCTEDYTGGKCMNVCPQDSKITPCTGKGDSDRWCCGGSDSCCKSNIGVITLDQVLGHGVSSSSLSISIQTSSARLIETVTETALVSTSPTITVGPTESTQSDNSKKPLGGIIAGIVVGAIAGIAWVVVGCWFIRRRLRKTQSQALNEHGPVGYSAEAHHAPVTHEMGSVEKRQELYDRSAPYELASEPSELESPGPRTGR
jgi:hypothetical protein